MNESRFFLKICEGCGVLWLRAGAIEGVYCRGCSSKLSEFPPPHAGKCRNNRIRMVGERSGRQVHTRCQTSRVALVSRQVEADRKIGGKA